MTIRHCHVTQGIRDSFPSLLSLGFLYLKLNLLIVVLCDLIRVRGHRLRLNLRGLKLNGKHILTYLRQGIFICFTGLNNSRLLNLLLVGYKSCSGLILRNLLLACLLISSYRSCSFLLSLLLLSILNYGCGCLGWWLLCLDYNFVRTLSFFCSFLLRMICFAKEAST